MAAMMKVMGRGEWTARAQEIATRDELYATLATVRYDACGRNGYELWTVPSRSERGAVHQVRRELATGAVRCDCHAAGYGLACGHTGAVVLEVEQRGWDIRVWTGVAA